MAHRFTTTMATTGGILLATIALAQEPSWEEFDRIEQALSVNEGHLVFLDEAPPEPVHHHTNRMRVDHDSLASGWIQLEQCHQHLDPVPAATIQYRPDGIRDLSLLSHSNIGRVQVDAHAVELTDILAGAQICLSFRTRASRSEDNSILLIRSGPFMRKFLDGYYPMRVTIELTWPERALEFESMSPGRQEGFQISLGPGRLVIEALFEGKLRTEIQLRLRE